MIVDLPSLLITDDDRAVRETLGDLFAARGFRTLLAGDGVEAVTLVRSEEIHLLLIDQHMPRLTGLEAIDRLKALVQPPPCILMSGQLDEAICRAAQQAPVFSVLQKPLRLPEITGVVADVMRRRYDWPPVN
jgi:CheY-like chemotaxis protein